MALSDEERNIIVGLEAAKAKRFLVQADSMVGQQQWDLAINRFYYACFHIVQALLIHNGLSAKTHAGMIRVFAQNFILTGMIDRKHGVTLSKLMQLRQTADYNCALDITQTDAERYVAAAQSFVEAVEVLLEASN